MPKKFQKNLSIYNLLMHIYQYLHVFAFCTIYRTVYNSNYMYMYM